MTSVQIKGIPEETHAVLLRRAARAHQSLQEYLLGLLVREASAPTLDEILDRADAPNRWHAQRLPSGAGSAGRP